MRHEAAEAARAAPIKWPINEFSRVINWPRGGGSGRVFKEGGKKPVEESFQTEMANQAAPSASTQPHRAGSVQRAEDGHNFLPQNESCLRLDAFKIKIFLFRKTSLHN